VEKGISFGKEINKGVPQGGIVSPILSNIYLHQLDKYIERLIEEKSSKKKNISKVNPKIVKYSTKLTELNKEYQDTKNKEKVERDKKAETRKEHVTFKNKDRLKNKLCKIRG